MIAPGTPNPLLAPPVIRLDRPLRLGRAATADVRLLHPEVSRHHADIRLADEQIWVHDLGSRAGVRVNGMPVREHALQEDDQVAFGPIVYLFKARVLYLLTEPNGVRLEVRHLALQRGGQLILADVDLTIPANHFVGILGPSGAGKTTLLRCLAGYLSPAAGQVTFDGLDLPAHREDYGALVGYVPQEDVVYGALTAAENLRFALQLRVTADLRPQERDEWVRQTLDRLHLAPVADQPVATLSGGQRKRVNVATELLTRPRVLFLDEPTAGLDPAAEARLMHLLRQLAPRGTTVVCTTHVLANLSLLDLVVVLAGGEVVYRGRPEGLLNHFQVQTYLELYEHLEALTVTAPPRRPEATAAPIRTPGGATGLSPRPASGSRPTPAHSRRGTLRQVVIQFCRGLHLIRRDKYLLVLLVGQPLFIGLLINLSQFRPNGLEPIFLFAVLASIWLGLNNTAREVVRDRAIYVRERLATIHPESYLAAKVLLWGGIGLLQLLLLVVLLRYGHFLGPGDAQDLAKRSLLYLLGVLWLTYASAMLLGLVISTVANTQETAVAMLPLVVLPQLLLTGVASGLHQERGGFFRSLPLLIRQMGETDRGVAGWVLEALSLITYSRPAMALLQNLRPDEVAQLDPFWARASDAMHLLLLLLATATALVAVFLWRERHWLEAA